MKICEKIDFKQLYICILLIVTSATIYGSYIYYKPFIIVLFLSSILINGSKVIRKNALIVFIILSSILLFNYFTWQSNTDGYIALIVKMFSIMLLANNVDIKKLMKYYVYFFSIYIYISLVNYSMLINNWEVVKQVPIEQVWGSEMRPTLLYTFPAREFYRNFGFYKEGGMYAIFLNIALIFSFNINNTKWITISRIMFIVTIATTLSTTGLIGAFIIVIGYSFTQRNGIIKKFIMAIVLISVLIIIENNYGIINNKFDKNNESFNERSSEISITINILEDNMLFGTGYQNAAALKKYTDITMTNGVLAVFIQFGLILGTIIIILFIINIVIGVRYKKNKVILSILFILFSASQPVMFQPLFLLVLFYKNNREISINKG